MHCYQNGDNHGDTLESCLNGRNTGSGTDTIKGLNDSLYITYEYNSGQLHGLFTRYYIGDFSDYIDDFYCYQNGINLSDSLAPCLNGRNKGTGVETIIDLRDSISITYEYENGQLDGLFTRYGFYDGAISYTREYKNGKRHGLYTSYNSDSSISSLYCYQNDIIHSTATEEQRNNPNSFTCP